MGDHLVDVILRYGFLLVDSLVLSGIYSVRITKQFNSSPGHTYTVSIHENKIRQSPPSYDTLQNDKIYFA